MHRHSVKGVELHQFTLTQYLAPGSLEGRGFELSPPIHMHAACWLPIVSELSLFMTGHRCSCTACQLHECFPPDYSWVILPSQFLNDSSLWVSNISCGRLLYTSQFRNKPWEPNQILILFLPAIFPWISLNKLPRWCVCLANTYWELSYFFYYPCLTWAHSLFPFCSPLSCYLHYLIALKIVVRLI